ncbi:hypothetical protein DFH09DRAFT_1369068 [Mycena vulgaris]|nr:hypothetical protein DFH09DRAFT_1369068 [Mycena vulgaris]
MRTTVTLVMSMEQFRGCAAAITHSTASTACKQDAVPDEKHTLFQLMTPPRRPWGCARGVTTYRRTTISSRTRTRIPSLTTRASRAHSCTAALDAEASHILRILQSSSSSTSFTTSTSSGSASSSLGSAQGATFTKKSKSTKVRVADMIISGVSSLLIMPMPFRSPQPPPSPSYGEVRETVVGLVARQARRGKGGCTRPGSTALSPARIRFAAANGTQYRAMPMERNDGGGTHMATIERAALGSPRDRHQLTRSPPSPPAFLTSRGLISMTSVCYCWAAPLILTPAPTTDECTPRTHNDPWMSVVSALLRSLECCADRDEGERGVDGANEASAAQRIAPTPRARAVDGGQHVRAGALREGVREARAKKPAQRGSKATKYITCSIINLIDLSSDL